MTCFKWIILAATLIWAMGKTNADAPKTYAESAAWAMHLLEGRRYGEAADAAQELVNRDANAAPSYQIRGALALLIGNPARARADFTQAATLAPSEPLTDYGSAMAALLDTRLGDAQARLAAASKSENLTDREKSDIETATAYARFLRGEAVKLAPSDDPLRDELNALAENRRNPAAGALRQFLTAESSAPRVREDDGLRALFEKTKLAEADVIEPPLRQMYATRLANVMAAAAQSGGPVQSVSGKITLEGAATAAGLQPALVQFSVDTQIVGIVNSAPFSCEFDTTNVTNGRHTIKIEASDAQGNILAERSRTLRVANAGKKSARSPHGDLDETTFDALETRLWNLIRLRPARKAAEWTLAETLARTGDAAGAATHRAIAAALDPDYKTARQAARAVFTPSSGPMAGVNIGPATKKQVALTFDDGPMPGKTDALLDALDKARVPATFFVVGQQAILSPNLIRRMAARGDDVANHSFTHPNLTQTLPTQTEAEILRTNVVIRALAGRAPRFFRPPGGNADTSVLRFAHQYGLTTTLWTTDALAAEDAASPDGLARFVISHARPGAIFLMHNGPEVTTRAIPALAAGLRAQGYELVTLTKLLAGEK